VAAAVAGVITSVGQMLLFFGGGGDRRNGNPLALLAMALLAPFAASLIQMAISRTREYDADEDGSSLTGDPLALASALRKIEQGVQLAPLPQDQRLVNASHLMIANPFRGGGMARMFSTHPPMSERIGRLERMAGRQLG
jgi:heat shock protein HtpX